MLLVVFFNLVWFAYVVSILLYLFSLFSSLYYICSLFPLYIDICWLVSVLLVLFCYLLWFTYIFLSTLHKAFSGLFCSHLLTLVFHFPLLSVSAFFFCLYCLFYSGLLYLLISCYLSDLYDALLCLSRLLINVFSSVFFFSSLIVFVLLLPFSAYPSVCSLCCLLKFSKPSCKLHLV